MLTLAVACVLLAVLYGRQPTGAQGFSSGSTGADGALDFSGVPAGTTVEFNPAAFNPPLDPDGDHVYHFTTVNVPAGVTVKLSAKYLGGPVYWLASGAVQINGTLDLNGQDGQNSTALINGGGRAPSLPGAGGFGGGLGGFNGAPPLVGSGPGGGGVPTRSDHDGGYAGHASSGITNSTAPAGQPYGNRYIVPLVGGSGGGGAYSGAGGGAGGGAILLASSVSITVNGLIQANAGRAGNFSVSFSAGGTKGGGGSGGAIRLVAPTVNGTGRLEAQGSLHPSFNRFGSDGRIRLEAFQHAFTGTNDPGLSRTFPNAVGVPATPPPAVRVVSVAGIAVPPNPAGSFELPDVTIDTSAATPVVIEGRFVPVGTVVRLHLVSEDGADQVVNSAPLAGTLEQSSATASVVFPRGFSRGFARAVWR